VIPIARTLPRWRRPLLVALALVTLGFVAQIPNLRAVFEPEALVPPQPDEEARARALLAGFTGREVPFLLLVEGSSPEGALSASAVEYLHQAARHFIRQPWIDRVEGLTTTPLPRAAPEDEGVTLDTLEAEAPSSTEVALERLVATDPVSFPMGMLSLAERTGGRLTLAPLVEGDAVEADELLTLRAAASSPLVRGRLVAPDGRRAVLAVVPAAEGTTDEAIGAVRAWLEAHPPPAGVEVHLAGLQVVRSEMVEALKGDQALLVGLAILGSLLVLLLGFRSWAGVLLPLGAAGITSGIVVGAMAWLGEPINLLNNVVPPLLISVGLGDSVHLVVRFREELADDGDRLAAARRTLKAMGTACLLTTLTTAVGFGSLIVSETEVVRRFGITAALGVLLAYAVTVTFLPAALPDFRGVTAIRARTGLLDALVRAQAELALRRPWRVVLASLAILAVSVFVGSGVRVDSALLDHLEPGSEAAQAVALLERDLGGVRNAEVVLAGAPGRYRTAEGLREVEALERWLEAQPGVLRAAGAPTPLEALWVYLAGPTAAPAFAAAERVEALGELGRASAPSTWAQYVSPDGARARIEVQLANESERRLNDLFDRIETHLATLPVDTVVTGEAHRSARGLDRLVQDLLPSLGLAVVIIFVLLGILFRSARVAFVSVLPNLLPLGVTLAYMALRDIPLHAGTAIVFTVSIGLVVDGTIHVLARQREEARAGRPIAEALRHGMVGSGRAVIIGAFTLLLGFAALLFASFVPIRWFAELSLVAILVALPADLLLLPALLALFAPRSPRPT
jgi:predicted RND superfamily exporter protein